MGELGFAFSLQRGGADGQKGEGHGEGHEENLEGAQVFRPDSGSGADRSGQVQKVFGRPTRLLSLAGFMASRSRGSDGPWP